MSAAGDALHRLRSLAANRGLAVTVKRGAVVSVLVMGPGGHVFHDDAAHEALAVFERACVEVRAKWVLPERRGGPNNTRAIRDAKRKRTEAEQAAARSDSHV